MDILRTVYRLRVVFAVVIILMLVFVQKKLGVTMNQIYMSTNTTAVEVATHSQESIVPGEELSLGAALDRLRPVSHDPVPANEVRAAMGTSNGDFLGNGYITDKFRDMSLEDVQKEFYKRITDLKYSCRKEEHYGRHNEGGNMVCRDDGVGPNQGKCLVYSFGILRDWSFDDEMNKELECEVHSYDPSIGLEDEVHRKPNHYFHNMGIWNETMVNNKGWKHDTFETLLEENKHTQKVVDILKIHIDGSEYPSLSHIMETNSLNNVKQLALTLHSPRWKLKQEEISVVDLAEIYDLIDRIEKAGFKKWKFDPLGTYSCGWITDIIPKAIARQICSFKLYYVNEKYIP